MRKDIAVIGISGRFPQANSLAEFRENLMNGRDSIRHLSETRKRDTGLKPDEEYWMLAYLEDIDKFDAAFFGVTPAEAETMDPHQRLLLEVAYEAFENAGYNVDDYSGTNTAVFMADTHQRYYTLAKSYDPLLITGNANAVTAGRIARFFNLWGPALMVDTACSSSLVAIHMACQEISGGACDQALVCAANLQIFPEVRQNSDGVGIMSSDGRNRTFSASATGTGSGEAVVSILLKPLDQALADSDEIHAVIKGSAINQDAQRSSSLTAPSSLAQAEVIKKAWKVAGIDPTCISYIEAHGTATKLGDPVEIDGINLAFREFTDRKQFCAVSSVKSNIGHTNFSAGIVGFVKVALSLKYRQLFPSLHFDDPNPFMDFIDSPIYVNTILRPWESETEKRCAGVSSFGISGTNCHIILQEAPRREDTILKPSVELITLSSKTVTGLRKNANVLMQWLTSGNTRLKDISYVTTKGRKHFDYRYAVVASDTRSLLTQLKSFVQDHPAVEAMDAPVWFVLSGNAPVDDALLDTFSRRFPSFRKCIGMCLEMLRGAQLTGGLKRFIFQYGLCNVLLDRGISINHVLGTGTGKVVIALLQKKISLADALHKVNNLGSQSENLKDRLPEFIATKLQGSPAFILELGLCGEVSDMLKSLRSDADQYQVAEFDEASEEKLLYIARELYTRNVNIHWDNWWEGQRGQRIALPTYQFEPVRYWLDDTRTSGATPVENWFYEMRWVEKSLERKKKSKEPKNFLVVSNGTQHSHSFSDMLKSAHLVVYVSAGSRFRQVSSTQYEIGRSEQDCLQLRTCLQQHGFDFDGFILISGAASGRVVIDHLDTELDSSLYLYLRFLKAFSAYLAKQDFQLVHLTKGSQLVHDTSLSPVGHAVYAAFKALQSDFPFADVRAIDVDRAFSADELNNELTVDVAQKFVSYRNGKRYVLQLERLNRQKAGNAHLTTKEGGVYLITGGASGVGLEISKALAENGSCNLVIVGRTVLPENENWHAIKPDDPLRERVEGLIDIEKKGCSVDYFAGDVCDKPRMERIVSEVYAKHGRVDGIVHVAGVMLYKSLEEMSMEALVHTIQPKVHGSMILGELVDTSKLDWFVMFSSLNSAVPQRHTIAYTVANAFEDGYAQWLRGKGVKAMAINWGAWGEAGQGRRDIHSQSNQNSTLRAWSNNDGIRSFAMALKLMHVNPVIADVSWKAFLNNPFFLMKDLGEDTTRMMIDTAELDGLTDIQAKLLQIWYDVLKVNRINHDSSFFDLGGHSLLGAKLINLIGQQLHVQLKFKDILEYPVFDDQCAYIQAKIDESLAATFSAIPQIEEQDYYRASHAQKRLWILHQFEKGTATNYNITQVFILGGGLHKPALEKAFSELIKRHEILRTTFVVIDHEPFQKVASASQSNAHIIFTDLHGERKKLQDHISAEENFQFDLEEGPLMRVVVVQVNPAQYAFILTMHHIVSDGWSIGILREEIATLYDKFSANLAHGLEPLRIQYKDYSAWQEKQLSGAQLEGHLRYWQAKLAEDFPRLEFPSDRSRTATNRNRAKFHLLKNLPLSSLDRIGRECDASLFMVLVTTVKILLSRYTEQSDIVIGAPFACRNHRDLENQIGFYVNTLPLRTLLNPDQGFKENLARVKDTILGVSEHENYPFDLLVESLRLQRDVNRSPVFDIVVTLQVANQSASGDWNSTAFHRSQDEEGAGKFDLFFEFIQSSDEMWLAVNYNPDLYTRARIDRMTSHYRNMVSTIVNDVHMPIRELPLLSAEESRQLLIDFNRQHVLIESVYTLHQHFEYWAASTPDAVAVTHHDMAITYRTLNEHANCLASRLRYSIGVRPEQVVAVMLGRSVNLLLSILAVWKAGAAYLPIDPGFPEERKQYILNDANATLLLTDQSSALSSFVDTIVVDEAVFSSRGANKDNPEHINSVNDLAYVIYTSGTTGTPKGVMIQHDTVVASLINQAKLYTINASDRLLQFATITFDASIYEIGLAFCHGATLVMIDKATIQDNLEFVHYVRSQGVTWTLLPPSYFNLLHPTELNTLRTLVTGGESGHVKKAEACLPYFHYFNAYGPTECSIVATIHQVTLDAQTSDVIPIGRPQAGTEIYIIDQHFNLMPIGIPGELCIGGNSVGRGYLNRVELTEQKFIKNPFGTDGCMYRTGDLAYWNPDGTITFSGRRDNQVKVRGYRIELDEIQRVLVAHPGVKDAVVVIAPDVDGGNTLVAYLTTKPGVTRETLQAHLANTLPSYMVPSHLMVLEELPLKSNGKIDKKALPLPVMEQAKAGAMERATGVEKLTSLWKDVLGIEQIAATDDFFKVGGDSLKAIRLRGRIAKVFDKTISIKDIFDFPTIEKLSQVIERAFHENHDSILPVPPQLDYALSRAQKRLWVLDQAETGQNAYNVFGSLILDGHLDVKALENAFRMLIQRHEILRTVFVTVKGEPRQRIVNSENTTFVIDYTDLSSEPGSEEIAYRLRQAETVKVFDLAKDGLLRVQLIRASDQRHVFGLTMHHIIADGWSLEIIIHEVLTFYNAFVESRDVALPPLRIQYKDYAHWHNTQLTGLRVEKLRRYWRSKLGGRLPMLDLPLDYPRPKRKTYNGASFQLTIDTMLSDRLRKVEHQFDVSRFMMLLASVKALLFRYTLQNDMVIGAVTAGRNHSDLENQIGYYLNTLAIRTGFEQGDRFADLLLRVKTTVVEAFEHEMYPFDLLIDDLDIERDVSRSAVFDVLVNLQSTKGIYQHTVEWEGLRVSELPIATSTTKYDLTFIFRETDEGISLVMLYNLDLFKPNTASLLLVRLKMLMEAVATDPMIPLEQIQLSSEPQLRHHAVEMNFDF